MKEIVREYGANYGGCDPWNLWDSKDHGVLYVRAKWNCRNPV